MCNCPGCQSTPAQTLLDPCKVTPLRPRSCSRSLAALAACLSAVRLLYKVTSLLATRSHYSLQLYNHHFRSHISDHMTTRKISAFKATVTRNAQRSPCCFWPLNSPFWQPLLRPGHSSSRGIRRWFLQVPLCLGTHRGIFLQAAFGHGQSTPDALPWQKRTAMSKAQKQ